MVATLVPPVPSFIAQTRPYLRSIITQPPSPQESMSDEYPL